MSVPPRLASGDLLPDVRTPPPGPESRRLAARLAAAEAPGVNTLYRGQPAILWREALGANVLDADGNRYLDLTSGFGVAAVGHRHPRVAAAVRQQAGALLHALGDVHGHPLRVELAERLAALAPVGARGEEGEEAAVYPAVSGSDAVEIAVKTAVLATARSAVVAFEPSYHGLTTGALALTSRPAFRRPFAAHLHHHLRRLPYGQGGEALERALSGAGDGGRDDAGPAACVVVEPVVGREGVIFPPAGWLAELAAACRRHGALLVADEIFTGFGRTGHLFACSSPPPVRPDLLVCGKALGGGLPVAAVIGPRRLMAAWQSDGEARHTATFIANPPACAAALAVLRVLEEEGLVARAARLGERVAERLAAWPGAHPAVTEVRGAGLLWGIELADGAVAGRLVAEALARGVLLLAGGPEGKVAQVVPPLTVSEEQLDTALDLLQEALVAAT